MLSCIQFSGKVYPWSPKFHSQPGLIPGATAETLPKLFEPITIRDVTFKNRVVVSPMCTYSAKDGNITDFHLVHLGGFALGGASLVFMEATGVCLAGRISPYCPTLHADSQIAALKRVADFVHANHALFGVQLAHSGRKGSTPPPFGGRAPTQVGTPDSWQPVGPSPIAFGEGWAVPHELTKEEISELVSQFVSSAKRASAAGVDVIEIHGAHGYLVNNFLSPISNHRADEYGGSFENRTRFLKEIVEAVRPVWHGPLFVRLSCNEWVDGGWNMDDTVKLAHLLKELGVDVVDCSSGGNAAHAKMGPIIATGAGYQVPFARQVKHDTGIMSMAVGLITEGKQAEDIIASGDADFVAVGRQHLREPAFTLHAAKDLQQDPTYPPQYAWSIGKFKM